MASTYTRANSPWIWIRYKTAHGKWCAKATKYRKDNLGDQRQAKLLARKQSEIEATQRPNDKQEQFDYWVVAWIKATYEHRENETCNKFLRCWRHIAQFLEKVEVTHPRQITYNHAWAYREHREKLGRQLNTIIHEMKVFALVMKQAVRRGWADKNPFEKLGWKRTTPKRSPAWTDEQIACVASVISEAPHWMQCTFWLGLYQAARLRQSSIPLSAIDWERSRIYWPGNRVKGGEPFAQEIDKRCRHHLLALVKKREGKTTLCDMPWDPSLQWRKFLDKINKDLLKNLSHHGLRRTWISRAALNGVPQAAAKAFAHHDSSMVHEIYQEVSPAAAAHYLDAVALPSFEEIQKPSLEASRDNGEE